MRIKQLVIYPIKGLGGINLQSAKALEKGFEHDRRYMLVDNEGGFLSQRSFAEMALFGCTINENNLEVGFKNEKLLLDLSQSEGPIQQVKVWKHQVDAIHVSESADEWFSDMLQHDCKLVKMNVDTQRKKSLLKAPRTTQLSFADGYPYLVLGTASVDHLNSKLESAVPINRFRANIIVESESAHQEDELDKFTLSGVKFRMIKPCARCPVITIDQATSAQSKEPLKTLASYRKQANKVYFGMNAVCLSTGGIINIGDKLTEAE